MARASRRVVCLSKALRWWVRYETEVGAANLIGASWPTRFKRDYYGEDANGAQMPNMSVFHRDSNGEIRHTLEFGAAL